MHAELASMMGEVGCAAKAFPQASPGPSTPASADERAAAVDPQEDLKRGVAGTLHFALRRK